MAVKSAANSLLVLMEAVVAGGRERRWKTWDVAVDEVLAEGVWAALKPLGQAGIASAPIVGTSSRMLQGSPVQN